uniref:Putative ovule protein n=1 Tax=Solanum chacoense TaxID=4108 RepID=A0A0V0HMC7_SOLCH
MHLFHLLESHFDSFDDKRRTHVEGWGARAPVSFEKIMHIYVYIPSEIVYIFNLHTNMQKKAHGVLVASYFPYL